jgi:hypothetical protein
MDFCCAVGDIKRFVRDIVFAHISLKAFDGVISESFIKRWRILAFCIR